MCKAPVLHILYNICPTMKDNFHCLLESLKDESTHVLYVLH